MFTQRFVGGNFRHLFFKEETSAWLQCLVHAHIEVHHGSFSSYSAFMPSELSHELVGSLDIPTSNPRLNRQTDRIPEWSHSYYMPKLT